MLLMQWEKILIFFYREKKYYTPIFISGKESCNTATRIKIKFVEHVGPFGMFLCQLTIWYHPRSQTRKSIAYCSCLYSTNVFCVPTTWGHSLLQKLARLTDASSQFFSSPPVSKFEPVHFFVCLLISVRSLGRGATSVLFAANTQCGAAREQDESRVNQTMTLINAGAAQRTVRAKSKRS